MELAMHHWMRAESLEHTLNRINKLDYTYRNTGTTYTKMCTMTVENTLAILADKQPMANCIYNRKELSTN